ncbi:MAG: flavin reductase family protein [Spirochaetaceae bacterium]|nr:MAG: flavin reductase family protein [Spirochaetaceae bacterium]
MEISPAALEPRQMHKLIIGSVVPRPIAWVSTISTEGRTNLAPFSFFNGVCASPPTLSLSFSYNPERPDHKKDSLRNIEATGEFVINVAAEPQQETMHATSGDFDIQISEIERLGLTTAPSVRVTPPRIFESPIQFECRLLQMIPVGQGPASATLVLGTVQHIHVDDHLIDNDYHIDIRALKPIGRLAGNSYCYVHEIFDLGPRPR